VRRTGGNMHGVISMLRDSRKAISCVELILWSSY
jgi:hypothetical protein